MSAFAARSRFCFLDKRIADRDDAVDDAHAEFTQVDDQVDYGDEDGEDVHSRCDAAD